MAGYRRVNYYELCRLCTSSEGTKMHIFREEGRRRCLPSKIQKCLPLQVQEEDSLPKIICSTCVDKLESYFEFREACINAEAMLESYFTSLKYSDDLTREGKVSVYVKDEPPKKKDEATSTKVKIPVNNASNVSSAANVNESGAVQPSGIQILTDAEGNRLTQYKLQVQGGITSLVPVAGPGGLPLSVSLPTLTQSVKQQTTSTSASSNGRSSEGGTQTTEAASIPTPSPLVAAVTITPHNQELLQQIGIASKDRNMVAEVLKLKNINVVDTASYESIAVGNSPIHGNTISSQLPNLVPAQIRLDQLNHLINSNLQINLGQVQQTQQQPQQGQQQQPQQQQQQQQQPQPQQGQGQGQQQQQQSQQQAQEENVQGKNVLAVNRSLGQHLSSNATKTEGVAGKVKEEGGDAREQKVAVANLNGSGGDRANNVVVAKGNMNEMDKTGVAGGGGAAAAAAAVAAAAAAAGVATATAEGTIKFEGNGVEMAQNLEEELEEGSQSPQANAAADENVTYECEFCAKLFKRKEHLFQHRKSHSGERPFVCATCAKAFSRKEHLLRHNVSHTGQKQYMCDVCKKSFSRKDNLHKHKKTHGINGPHVCETCGKSFVVKHYYVMHKAQHENLPNTENSTGATIKHLTSTNSTTNPLPFKCDLCTKSFSMKQYLTSHRMRHRGKIKKEDAEEAPQAQQPTSSDITVPQPTTTTMMTSFPAASTAPSLNLPGINTQLTTINPNALLAPNIIHHSSANVVHIGNNSYICTPNVTQEILDQYRKLSAS